MVKYILRKILLIFTFLIFLTSNLYAIGYDGARDSHFSPNEPSFCETGNLGGFDPLGASNRDVDWLITNPTCYGFIAGYGAAVLLADLITSHNCLPLAGAAIGSPFTTPPPQTPPASPTLGLRTATRVASVISTCALRTGLTANAAAAASITCGGAAVNPQVCALYTSYSVAAGNDQTRCCVSGTAFLSTVASGVAALRILFETASDTFENARICGHDWYSWKEFNVSGDPATSSDISRNRGYWKRGAYENSYSKKLQDVFTFGRPDPEIDSTRAVTNKHYREYLYGGVEYTDGSCSSPSNWDRAQQVRILGYSGGRGGGMFGTLSASNSSPQRYYMKGAGVASNYACYRYLLNGTSRQDPAELAAYDCCIQRSKSTICVENEARVFGVNNEREHKFCGIGEECMVAQVGFTAYTSNSQVGTICAKTKTLCPYDHLLGGGTEMRQYMAGANGNVLSGRMNNYCQFNKHCVKVPSPPYIRMNNYTSAFISSACMNFVGHSQNVYNTTNEIMPVSNIKNFSAPIVECMSETIKNMIQNRAGYTQCSDPDEIPRRSGSHYVCDRGYDFREGDKLTTPSPFEQLQGLLRSAIKLVLVLSIVFLGYSILLGGKPVDKKTVVVYVVKFAFVVYFALGTGWQDLFIDNIFKVSSDISSIVSKYDDESLVYSSSRSSSGSSAASISQQSRLDGCQFPKFNAEKVRNASRFPNAASDPFYEAVNPENRKYARGFEYLKPWDTLDCKFVRALGFGPDMTVPNLVITIYAGLLTGGLGILFVIFALMFAFFYVSMIIRALHIFLVSTIAIALLVFISPITITMILFSKTKNIFDKWLKQLFGFIIQPVILFAYISIFVAVMDTAVYGIRTDLPDNGGLTFSGDGLDQPKGTVCNGAAVNNSLYCIFGFSRFGSYSGLEPIGIIGAFIVNMNKEKLDAVIRAGLLMFIFASFMDKISELAATLTGSKGISSNTPSAMGIASKVGGTARDIQKRASRVAGAHIKRAGRVGRGAVGTVTRAAAHKSKKLSSKDSNSGTPAPSDGGGDGGGSGGGESDA